MFAILTWCLMIVLFRGSLRRSEHFIPELAHDAFGLCERGEVRTPHTYTAVQAESLSLVQNVMITSLVNNIMITS